MWQNLAEPTWQNCQNLAELSWQNLAELGRGAERAPTTSGKLSRHDDC
jgi:hypothetical protein